jgi:TolB-like protein/Tfp pilus assembly protein PilF
MYSDPVAQVPENPLGTAVDEQLQRILSSSTFGQAGRLRDLLQYLVARTAGGGDAVKEMVVALDVFGRDSHDPKTDSVVRVTAGKLRSKLEEYYAGPGRLDPVRIDLPKGSYTLVFSNRDLRVAPRPYRRWAVAVVAGVGAIVAVIAVPGMWKWYGPLRAEVPSVAVLPFIDLSPQRDFDYFCDGLTEELIDSLARVRGLDVVARTSAFQFKGKPYDIRAIGRQLGARAVLEGSVRRSGDQLRVTAQLNDSRSGYHLWSRTYEIRMAEIFSTQEQIVRAIVSAVQTRGDQMPRVEGHRNLDAWQHYLRGRFLAGQRKPGSAKQAVAAFEQALAIDPNLAPAHAEVARATFALASPGGPLSPSDAKARIEHSIDAALRLDPNLPEAYDVQGRKLAALDWDWNAAIASHRRAVDLSPGSAQAHTNFGITLAFLGREEGIEVARRAAKLDPLSIRARQLLSQALYFQKRYREAMQASQEAIALDGKNDQPYIGLSLAQAAQGDYGSAVRSAEAGWGLQRGSENVAWLGLIAHPYAASGKRDKAIELLRQIEEVSKAQYVSPMIFARVHIGLGNTDRVFEYLRRGFEQHDILMPWLKCDMRFDSIRGDPRYQELLLAMKMN